MDKVRRVARLALQDYPDLASDPGQWLLVEIERFLKEHPRDDNFKINVNRSGTGCGSVQCLERGCGRKVFTLGENPFIGTEPCNARGVGSLTFTDRWIEHISTDEKHRTAREARVRAELRGQPAPGTSPPPSPSKAAALAAERGAQQERTRSASGSPRRGVAFVPLPSSSRSSAGRISSYQNDNDTRFGGPRSFEQANKRSAIAGVLDRPVPAPKFVPQEPVIAPTRSGLDLLQIARPRGLGYDPVERQPIASGSGAQIQIPVLRLDDTDDEDQLDQSASGPASDDVVPFNPNSEYGEFFRDIADNEFFGNATVDKAVTDLGLTSQNERIPGMKISLLPHQFIGVSWMVAQEKGKYYGGILADEMGLGKTIQAIATMLAHPSEDKAEKTTLIVAPLALIEQWAEEIEEKVKKGTWKVLVYHGDKKKNINKTRQLSKYDIVITTYSTLSGEYPDEESEVRKLKKKARKSGQEVKEDDISDLLELQPAGVLMRMSWYRVILDEAQFIRNRHTKMSRTVAELDAMLKWSLTGTPVTNGLGDLYPLLRFINVKPWYTWREFSEHVVKLEKRNSSVAGHKAQVILRALLLRRKKDSMLDGKRLVELPPKITDLTELEFTPDERAIYDAIESKTQAVVSSYIRKGTVLKQFSSVLAMLLRLRQLCLHPSLILEQVDQAAIDRRNENKRQEELERARTTVSEAFVAKMKQKRLEAAIELAKIERTRGAEAEADLLVSSDECAICMEAVAADETRGVVTECCHVFCGNCLDEVLQTPVPEDFEDGAPRLRAGQHPCPTCRQGVSREKIFRLDAFEPTDAELADELGDMDVDTSVKDDEEEEADQLDDEGDDLNGFIVPDDTEPEAKDVQNGEEGDSSETESNAKVPKPKSKLKTHRLVVDSDEDEEMEEFGPSDEEEAQVVDKNDKGRAVPPKKKEQDSAVKLLSSIPTDMASTKLSWVIDEIKRVDKEDPDDKILVLCSFTSALELLDEHLRRHGIQATRYQGNMSKKNREASLSVIKKSKGCKVMLMSLKAGGVGLNLCRLNRVISLDFAWSKAVENQATDRVHRIGQLKEVKVHRLTIRNTVEERIRALQDRKQGLADASLGEGSGKKLGKLSVNDIAGLFGLSANGKRLPRPESQPRLLGPAPAA